MKPEIRKANSLEGALKVLLDLRAQEFWSFRGQRNQDWSLGLHKPGATLETGLKQFQKRCLEFPRQEHVSETDQWRWLFYAQHHGLRTRLLDWTTNPLVALYFAVENIFSGADDDKDFGAVWAVRVSKKDFRTPEQARDPMKLSRWIMINPPPITHRIVRQSGKFSYHPQSHDCSLEAEPQRNTDEGLVKVELTARHRRNPSRDIRKQLGIMNVHHASLFPDADGVARFINDEWVDIAISFRDELKSGTKKPPRGQRIS